jgi:hypothetical protein
MNNNRKMTNLQKFNVLIVLTLIIVLTNVINNGGFTL